MLFRALLLSLLLHAFLLLGSPLGESVLRQGLVPGRLYGVLKAQTGHHANGVSSAAQPIRQEVLSGDRSLPGRLPAKILGAQPVIGNAMRSSLSGSEVSSLVQSETGSDEVLRQYRLALARTARQFQLSDVNAGLPGQGGEVLVVIRLDPTSAGAGIEQGASSGDRELDVRALGLAGRAIRLTPVPVALRGRSLLIPLAILYASEE